MPALARAAAPAQARAAARARTWDPRVIAIRRMADGRVQVMAARFSTIPRPRSKPPHSLWGSSVRADTKIRERPAAGAARALRADAGSFPLVVAGHRHGRGAARMARVARDLGLRTRAVVGARGAARRAGRGRRGIGGRALGGGYLGPCRLSGHRSAPARPVPRPPRQPGRLPAAPIPGHQRRRGRRGMPPILLALLRCRSTPGGTGRRRGRTRVLRHSGS